MSGSARDNMGASCPPSPRHRPTPTPYPTLTPALLAARFQQGELWVCYLEKAMAALSGGWDKIQGGQVNRAWSMLLGCKETFVFIKAWGNTGAGEDQWVFRPYPTMPPNSALWPEHSPTARYGHFNPNTNSYETLANSCHDGDATLWPMAWPACGGGPARSPPPSPSPRRGGGGGGRHDPAGEDDMFLRMCAWDDNNYIMGGDQICASYMML
jgi:hypothetical protein